MAEKEERILEVEADLQRRILVSKQNVEELIDLSAGVSTLKRNIKFSFVNHVVEVLESEKKLKQLNLNESKSLDPLFKIPKLAKKYKHEVTIDNTKYPVIVGSEVLAFRPISVTFPFPLEPRLPERKRKREEVESVAETIIQNRQYKDVLDP